MKKLRKYRIIDEQLKLQVMEQLKMPGYNVTALSKSYGIAKTTLHGWKSSLKLGCSANLSSTPDQFVELRVTESKKNIKKATIAFEHVTISFEGKIICSDLISIIRTLEASC